MDNIKRNSPSEEGRHNDPNLRDESAIQPGVNTISKSDTDEANEHLTKTSSDNFNANEGHNADPAFDEIENNED